MLKLNSNYYNNYPEINNSYNVFYPIGNLCSQTHIMFFDDSKEKKQY